MNMVRVSLIFILISVGIMSGCANVKTVGSDEMVRLYLENPRPDKNRSFFYSFSYDGQHGGYHHLKEEETRIPRNLLHAIFLGPNPKTTVYRCKAEFLPPKFPGDLKQVRDRCMDKYGSETNYGSFEHQYYVEKIVSEYLQPIRNRDK